MERFYQNHVEAVPATASWICQQEDPEYMFRNELLNHVEPTQFFDSEPSDHNYCPIPYGPMPVFLHAGGYMTSPYQSYIHNAISGVHFFPYGSQFNYIHQPIFHDNLVRLQDDMPVPFHMVHSMEMFDGGVGCGDNRYAAYQSDVPNGSMYSHIEGYPFTEPYFFHSPQANAHLVYGYSYPVFTSGCWGWDCINYGANLYQSSHCPTPQGCLQRNFPSPDDKISRKVANRDARYINQDSYRGFEGSVAFPKPVSFHQAASSSKKKFGSCHMGLSYTSGTEIPIGRNSSQRQHGHKNRIGSNPSKSSLVSSSSAKQSDQQGEPNSYHSINPAPPCKTGNLKTRAPRQVWQNKNKSQPSASRSKRSKKHNTTPVYHITWDGFDGSSEFIGQNCHLCLEDLSYSPMDDEFEHHNLIDEPSNLPEVSILPCGHAFHSLCLQLITAEEQSRDPPCHICFSDTS
ncbi:uncharacterized protein LOC130792896 [Actinidia eriantha]|uniref:uncharacterized protein LOC130792896 n=1 Tax=Actinidia eriantha TaxID=165200 RepID=UPI002587ED96|nr:uncharacterized protein LOC130792896 [Actinidia eriantha]